MQAERAASKPVLLCASLCQLQPALPELDLLGSACFLRDCSPLPLLLETERCSVLFFNLCRLFWTRAELLLGGILQIVVVLTWVAEAGACWGRRKLCRRGPRSGPVLERSQHLEHRLEGRGQGLVCVCCGKEKPSGGKGKEKKGKKKERERKELLKLYCNLM